jgi:predicted GTPase
MNKFRLYQSLNGNDPIPSNGNEELLFTVEREKKPIQHFVLLPLGKTGAGKSSLLNTMFGIDLFKAKPGARVIKCR